MERIDAMAERMNCSKLEAARRYFADEGCQLLAKGWEGCMAKMPYQCGCGELGCASWNNFTKGKRCGKCCKQGPTKKRSLEEIKDIFNERGCEFLDDEFKGIHYKHRYRCKCGREAEITFAGFHHQQQYCAECGLAKNRREGHHDWKPDRKQHRQDQLFRKKCYKALATCLSLTGQQKWGRTHELLGYTHQQLQEHIANHPRWPELEDTNWHLDHIFPVTAFLEDGIIDMKIINHLDNLQPLSQQENNSKHGKYDKKAFKNWLKKHNV